MKETLIPVFLTEIEAQSFIEFQKHRALIGLLQSIKAFDIRQGSVTINFDPQGKISSVQKNEEFRT